MLMDISGACFGAAFGRRRRRQVQVVHRPQRTLFLAMKRGLFRSKKEYRARMTRWSSACGALPEAEGLSRDLCCPGSRGARGRKARRSGIPYSAAEIDPLQDEAVRAGVAKLMFQPTLFDS